MYPWPLDMVLPSPPQNLNVYFAPEVLKHQPILSLSLTVHGEWPLQFAADCGQKEVQKTRAGKRGRRPASRSPRRFPRRGEVAEPPDERGLELWETLNMQIKSYYHFHHSIFDDGYFFCPNLRNPHIFQTFWAKSITLGCYISNIWGLVSASLSPLVLFLCQWPQYLKGIWFQGQHC